MAGKMIAVGDNVVDCYLDDHVYYPGGNAVNVAVNCRRDGIEDVAYIGMFGNDGKAEHLKWALTQENVHFERSRTMYAPSGSPGVRLIDGDRKFVGGPRNTAQHVARIRLTPEDLDYIEQYGLCHTSCFSSIEYELPEMAKRYPGFLEQIEDGVSTYNIMCEQYGVRMRRAYREITLAYATNEQAKMLGCAPSAPLFKTFKVVYDEQGLPVHMSSTYTQADNVVLTVENGNYRKELIEKQSG